MKTLKKILILLLVTAVISVGPGGCGNNGEHPSDDHPSSEHPTEEHPTEEHPNQ
jgi:hypothetical protein